ncbi:hypothetical protein DFR24_3143 [Panacagrimonas perspica]|uniref:DUF3592 domain-containing protein n=1 Tax=Panacagrimonas perspica TaxID=381431 RepID=A0A4R7P518_9GAMM|nr:hypothetical protein [Panacagrimonas perspica]TDU28768.1 hypothetical protein DFR24_3143 [Panacagrimonas perspica]THD02393.1 hypothetical protein B1810_15900 [Panacagrimonas perspica]
MPTHRKVFLWASLIPLAFLVFQVGMRVWLLKAGDEVVGVVTVANDSCRTKNRANCFLGRAVVDPKMDTHKFKTTKIPGGRFYDVGEELPMRIYPAQRLYLAQVYDVTSWILGPARTALILLLLLLAAAMPAARKVFWIVPCVLVAFLFLG